MKNLKLAHKFSLLTCFVTLLFSLAIGLVYSRLKDNLYQDKKIAIQQLVTANTTIIEHYLALMQTGQLSLAEAQRIALDAIRFSRFGDDNYFFISDTQARMVLHPIDPQLEGQNLSTMHDPDGKLLFLEMATIAKTAGEGFVSYKWKKPGLNEPVSKISFVKLIPEWNWIVGAGLYQDDVEAELAEVFTLNLVILMGAISVSLLLVFYVSLTVTRPLSATLAMIKALENGDLNKRLNLEQQDEVGQLAKALDRFADNMRDEVLAAFKALSNGDLTFEAQGVIREPLTKTNAALMQLAEEKEILGSQLLQSQKLELVGHLAGGIAHDFNNMLAIISGNVELALRKTETGRPVTKHLEQIKETTERSTLLTRQLLGFARKQAIEPVVMTLNNAIEDMLKMLRRLIREEIKLVWNPAMINLKVLIDPSQLNQILTNLVVNARDAIESTGTLSIKVEKIFIDEAASQAFSAGKSGEYVQLAVSDDGCGMSREIRERIYEPFFTTKEINKGTGLGLSTVYGIIKQNNGFINVYSEPGHGTTFRIYFPQADEETSVQTASRTEISTMGTETILLVEDEKILLEIGKKILTDAGYHVLATSDPDVALQLAANHAQPIDLLLSDVIMPKLNGKDLAGCLKAAQPDLRVAYMSGYASDIIANHGLLDEGVILLQKPFTSEMLTRKVRKALDTPAIAVPPTTPENRKQVDSDAASTTISSGFV